MTTLTEGKLKTNKKDIKSNKNLILPPPSGMGKNIIENTIKEDEEDKFKPCPFCGNTEIASYRNGNSHYAYCVVCEASTKNNSVMTSKKAVLAQWNLRTNL